MSAYLDIGDVCGADLVGKEDGLAMEQIREPSRPLGRQEQIWLKTQGAHVHLPHEMPCR
jgi:hypothetical protein